MKVSIPQQEPVAEQPAIRMAILFEIAAVFLPFFLGMVFNDLTGTDHIPLIGDLVILGTPPIYLGLSISLAVLWATSRRRGAQWGDFGLSRPTNWLTAVLKALGVALGVFVIVAFVINPVIRAIPGLPPQDLSRFDYLRGDLPNLIIQLVLIWLTAGFLEEFLFRGYLMNRLMDLQGQESRAAWVIALVGQAVIFGVAHSSQSPGGMLKVGLIGLVFGVAYLAVGRNLWPLILAHGLIDSLDMIGHYLGG